MFKLSGMLLAGLLCGVAWAEAATPTDQPTEPTPVTERIQAEEKTPENYFAINFYEPTYILPFYYTGSPANTIYGNSTPGNEPIQHTEIKYQLSFKVPLWEDMFKSRSSLYLAYTQMSYWQAYNHMAFFRETDYQPELFVATHINKHLWGDWQADFINVGTMHQSNGQGGSMERSWNRIYIAAIASKENWQVMVQPWYIIHDSTMEEYNPDIGQYLGYGRVVVGFKYKENVISLNLRNAIESSGKRTTTELTWSFPMTQHLKGFLQVFNGYGQSLIEYNQHTTSAGVGIALSDWL